MEKSNHRLAKPFAFFILIFVFIVPFIICECYTLPRNDEYAFAYGIVKGGGWSLFKAVKFSFDEYRRWQGTFFSEFLFYILNPIIIAGVDAVPILNLVGFLLFVISEFLMIHWAVNKANILEKKYVHFFSGVLVILSLDTRFMKETLFWSVGYLNYSAGLIIGLACIIFLVSNRKVENRKQMAVRIVACIGLFLQGGMSLQVSASLCWIALLALTYMYFKREVIRPMLFGLSAVLLGTVINVLAPGNYVRKDGLANISLIKGVFYTVKCVYVENKRLMTETFVIYAFVALFIFAMVTIKPQNSIILNPVLVISASIVNLLISTFPVVYGYGSPVLAARGYEIMDLYISLWGVYVLLSIANHLKLRGCFLSKSSLIVVAIVAFMLLTTKADLEEKVLEIPSVQCFVQLLSGRIPNYSKEWRRVALEIENSDDDDVVVSVERKWIDMECLLDRCEFMEDSTDWVNNAASVVYGKNSIRLEVID